MMASEPLGDADSKGLSEDYRQRPDALGLVPRTHPLGARWDAIKQGQMNFIAFLLEAYPSETQIYFLARDGEYLYDLARWLLRGTPDLSRVHLLNVSSVNLEDVHLRDYLEQEGLSERTLLKGTKALLVDTGYKGSIPLHIQQMFSETAAAHLNSHLILSLEPKSKIPSSRSFANSLSPLANVTSMYRMNSLIRVYEKLPHYNGRSDKFEFRKGRWRPVSTSAATPDGEVSRYQTIKHMEDIGAYAQLPATQSRFAILRQGARRLKKILELKDKNQAKEYYEHIKTEHPELGSVFESMVRDFWDIKITSGAGGVVTLEDLGLLPILPQNASWKDILRRLALERPQWESLADNLDLGIDQLFQEARWNDIEDLMAAKLEAPVDEILFEKIKGLRNVDIQIRLFKFAIDVGNDSLTWAFAHRIAMNQSLEKWKPCLLELIEYGEERYVQLLVEKVLYKEPSELSRELLNLISKRGGAETLKALEANRERYTFWTRHPSEIICSQVLRAL
jgi:hypothetical protein